MNKNDIKANSLQTLRKALFDTMFDIRNGNREIEEASAVSKLAHNVIESYKVEIKAVEVANTISENNSKLKNNIKALE